MAYGKKKRLTVSPSHDTVEYLESARAQAQASSMSAYFESIVRDLQAKTEMALIEAIRWRITTTLAPLRWMKRRIGPDRRRVSTAT